MNESPNRNGHAGPPPKRPASKPTLSQKTARLILTVLGQAPKKKTAQDPRARRTPSGNNGGSRDRQRRNAQGGYPNEYAAQRRTSREAAPPQSGRAPDRGQVSRSPAPQGARRPMTPEERRRYSAYVQKRRRTAKLIRIMKIAVPVVLFILLLLILSLTVFFKIKTINVTMTDDTVYSEEEIQKGCGIRYGEHNLFMSDIEVIRQRLEKRLPYIGKAVVKRHFPSSIDVTVTPTITAAAIDCKSGYLLIDKNGKMLEFTNAVPKAVLILRCTDKFDIDVGSMIKFKNDDLTLKLYKEILDEIEKTKIKDITLVDIRVPQSIKLMYQNRLTLYLGTDTMLEKKLLTAIKTLRYEDDGSKTKTGTIDLRTVGVAYVKDTGEKEDEASDDGDEAVTEAENSGGNQNEAA
ncbi:MAG: FtsQ-type POTRA domain-containing protein [Clostridiales bacterium]|nr:FtsQ-type POTRA domain-containing protein [Clostridiales bacterium]